MVRASVLRGAAWGQALSPLGGASLCVAVPIPQEKTGGRERPFRPFRFSSGVGEGRVRLHVGYGVLATSRTNSSLRRGIYFRTTYWRGNGNQQPARISYEHFNRLNKFSQLRGT